MFWIRLCIGIIFANTVILAFGQTNDEVSNATNLPIVIQITADNKYYEYINPVNTSNNLATSSNIEIPSQWSSVGKDVWFSFNINTSFVSFLVVGGENQDELKSPLISLYTYQSGTSNLVEVTNGLAMVKEGNTCALKAFITPNQLYFLRVSADNNAIGTFQLRTIDLYEVSPSNVSCETDPIYLCSATNYSRSDGEQTTDYIYRWTASRDAPLTFTITPNVIDDIDWALFDLTEINGCQNISPQITPIRYAYGHGIACPDYYYSQTGLNMSSVDFFEGGGCLPLLDGFVKYLEMKANHEYALLISNWSNQQRGYNVEFNNLALLEPTISITASCIQTRTISLTIMQVSNYTYQWDGPNGFVASGANVSLSPLTDTGEGVFTVTTYWGNCYTITTKYFEGLDKSPNIQFTTEPTLPANLDEYGVISITNNTQLANNYLWDFGDGYTSTSVNPSHVYLKEGIYQIKLVAYNEKCEISASSTEKVVVSFSKNALLLKRVYRPSAGDDRLANFSIFDKESNGYCTFMVIDLSGNMVYYNENYKNDWNFENQLTHKTLENGTYYYKVFFRTTNGKLYKGENYFDIVD